MSFFKSLFGFGRAPEDAAPAPAASEDYAGYTIVATPIAEGGEHRLAGTIEKEIAGEVKVYSFVRADKFPSRDTAATAALDKGRRIIDEQGDAIFKEA